MKKQITHVAPLQVAKVFALLYFIASIPLVVLMGLSFSNAPKGMGTPLSFLIAMPFLYLIFGFIFTIIGAWVYNLVAGWVGGVEYTSTEKA